MTYANQMPKTPPRVLVNNEVTEKKSAPHISGTYPPAMEPTTIPSMIMDFRDTFPCG